jgi:hypothetical protein
MHRSKCTTLGAALQVAVNILASALARVPVVATKLRA